MSKIVHGNWDDSTEMLSFWKWLWKHSGYGIIWVLLLSPILWNRYKKNWQEKTSPKKPKSTIVEHKAMSK